MIQVTILGAASSSFSGVNYNEKKVAEGKAKLLEAYQMQFANDKSSYIDYFKLVSSLNRRVEKPQFHAVISTRGREHSFAELHSKVKPFLEELGYGDQPYLVYAHGDTDNNHIHIVSTRVNVEGKKISDRFEKIRSQKAMHRVLGHHVLLDIEASLNKIVGEYSYSTFGQFKAIVESKDYKVSIDKEKGTYSMVKYGEQILKGQSISKLENTFKAPRIPLDEARNQMKSILTTTMEKSHTYDELVERLRESKIDLILYRNKEHDYPYGYTVVNHQAKMALAGSELVKVKSMNAYFSSRVNRRVENSRSPEDIETLMKYRSSSERGLKDVFRNAGYEVNREGVYKDGNQVLSASDFKVALEKSLSATETEIFKGGSGVVKKFIIESGKDRTLADLQEHLQRQHGIELYFHRDRNGDIQSYSAIAHNNLRVFHSKDLVDSKHFKDLQIFSLREERLGKLLKGIAGHESRVNFNEFSGYVAKATGMRLISYEGKDRIVDFASSTEYALQANLSRGEESREQAISLPSLNEVSKEAVNTAASMVERFLNAIGSSGMEGPDDDGQLKRKKKKKRGLSRGRGRGDQDYEMGY